MKKRRPSMEIRDARTHVRTAFFLVAFECLASCMWICLSIFLFVFLPCPVVSPEKQKEKNAINLPIIYRYPCTLPKLSCIHVSSPHWAPPATSHGAPPLPTSCHVTCLPTLSCLSLLYMCRRGLCLFRKLVCNLLPRGG